MKKLKISLLRKDVITCGDAVGIVVPQYANECDMTGVSAILLASRHGTGILDYDVALCGDKLPYGKVLVTSGQKGVKLLNVSLLGAPEEKMPKYVFSAVFNALYEAEKLGVKTLVIPALATGQSGCLSFVESARNIFTAIEFYQHLLPVMVDGCSLQEVRIILHDEGAFEIFRKVWQQKSFVHNLQNALATYRCSAQAQAAV